MLILQGGVRRKEGLNIAACLLYMSLPIRAEDRTDPSYELPDGPLPPLLACSYPVVNGRPSLVRYPIPPHLQTHGVFGNMGIEI